MRFVKVMVIVILVASLGLNFVLYTKFSNKRSILSVNGQGVTKKDMDDYLENKEGITVKAAMTERLLIEQEAKKQGVYPTEAEVEEDFNNQKEINWQFAQQIAANPWKANEAKNDIRTKLCQIRLLTKEVPVSDEELKEEYEKHPYVYDKPEKAHLNLAVLTNPEQLKEIKQLMEKNDPPVTPATIRQQYPTSVMFLGNENKFTIQRPFGGKPSNALIDSIFAMKPNDVKDIPVDQSIQQVGGKAMVGRMLDIVPGSKADLNDPKIKERLKVAIAGQRSKPWKEYLSGLWANTKFESEDANDKRFVEMVLFPERTQAESK